MNPIVCLMDSNSPAVSSNCAGTYWLVPVTSLNAVGAPTYHHAYILPDNSVWVLNHDGSGWLQIVSSGGDSQPTTVVNEDGYITISGSGTYSVIANLNETKIIALIGDEISASLTNKANQSDLDSTNDNLATVTQRLDSMKARIVGQIDFTPTVSDVTDNIVIIFPNIGAAQYNVQVAFAEDLAIGAEIGTAPAEATPTGLRRIIAAGNDGNAYRIQVRSTGKMYIYNHVPAGTYLDIADVNFI